MFFSSVKENDTNASSQPPSAKQARLTVPLPSPIIPSIDVHHAIVSCVSPSIELFRERYMSRTTPVILRDIIGHWPAMNERRWTVDYIRRIAGSRLVPIEIGSTLVFMFYDVLSF